MKEKAPSARLIRSREAVLKVLLQVVGYDGDLFKRTA
jgi:hypothetical protein